MSQKQEKIKFTSLVSAVSLMDTIKEVVPTFEKELGLTEKQLEKIEKKLVQKVMEKADANFRQTLLDGKAVDFYNGFKVFAYTSTGYKNPDGTLKKRVSAKTHKAFHETLNTH